MFVLPHYVRLRALALVFGALVLGACSSGAASSSQTVKAATLHGQMVLSAAPLIIDARTPDEFAAGHIPGAINIPYDQMDVRSVEIMDHKDKPVVLYCRSGRRSGIASEILVAKGFTTLALLEGDMPGWESDGYPVER